MNTYEDVVRSLLESLAPDKHKVFISYYHHDDEFYRSLFEYYFGSIFINKSVRAGEIDSENRDEYIKRLVREGFISAASVVVVLVGAKTYCRKHVDWEISAALNPSVGGSSGLLGILLPTHPDSWKVNGVVSPIPERLADNLRSGYASLYPWTTNLETMRSYIEDAFNARISRSHLIDNSLLQFVRNRCD